MIPQVGELPVSTLSDVVRRTNTVAIAFFAVAYVVTQIMRHLYGKELGGRYGLIQLMDLRVEQNLPTAYSALLLAAAALAVAATFLATQDNLRRYWGILAAVLTFLAFDEAALLHERWTFFLRRYVETEGVLKDSWVIVYSILVVIAGTYFLPFLRRLPADTRKRFVLAGMLYVGSSLGMEMIEGYYESYYGTWTDGRYAILAGIEEICELIAMAFFLDSVLRHLMVHGRIRAVALLR